MEIGINLRLSIAENIFCCHRNIFCAKNLLCGLKEVVEPLELRGGVVHRHLGVGQVHNLERAIAYLQQCPTIETVLQLVEKQWQHTQHTIHIVRFAANPKSDLYRVVPTHRTLGWETLCNPNCSAGSKKMK